MFCNDFKNNSVNCMIQQMDKLKQNYELVMVGRVSQPNLASSLVAILDTCCGHHASTNFSSLLVHVGE